ncbi:MAG TPA: Gfo/Idh/MocA family oxidoreductase [Tepidisphaeraceae bacterium]|jgi:predicted dehydrogenase
MKTIRFGIIGGGLMGKEFVSAAARWCHLLDAPARPEIVSVCSARESTLAWFKSCLPLGTEFTTDYRKLLDNPEIDAVYIAVPHHLHQEMYIAAVEAGKHFLGEKPFGIDKPANDAILAAIGKHPNLLVRCSSEFPFYPAVQKIGQLLEQNAFGHILEVSTGFLHSSDLDPNKPINWKRQVEFNGEYGCMGDLGMHVCHVPFRAGITPLNVRAILSNVYTERLDGKGNRVPKTTWDNATLLTLSRDRRNNNGPQGALFPWTLKTHRIAPGQKNSWYIEILGTKTSVRWSTHDPKRLELLRYEGSDQTWQHLQVGYEPTYKTITGPIFEFGFTDAMLQMFAAYVYELAGQAPRQLLAMTVTPEETALSHRLFSAALQSQRDNAVVEV